MATGTLLARFLDSEQMTQGEFARRSGIGRAMVTKYVNGDRRPGLRTALLIQEHTGGKVPAEYWSEFQTTKKPRPVPTLTRTVPGPTPRVKTQSGAPGAK